jgi:NhaA family Na+:H+ antiporter
VLKPIIKPITTFFKSEIAIGISLLAATIAAMLIANSENHEIYKIFFSSPASLNIEFIGLKKEMNYLDWINDFLMTIFFLLIGLELKKEILIGELSTKRKLALPAIAALGGIIFPILIFFLFNFNHPENMRGFSIPAATDIAFAYGVMSLFGKRFSNSLKVFLVALAVLDDLAAILIIAFFYSHEPNLSYIALAFIALLGLGLLNFFNSRKIHLYLILGFFLWLMILKSGVHPTISGIILALFIPLRVGNKSPLSQLAHKISPSVNFLILPIFAFANAGVPLQNFSTDLFTQPLILGIACGLFFGKQIGVMFFSFLAVKFNIAHLPRGTSWSEFYVAAILTGIGFTMSLFVGSLAFTENNSANNFMLDEVKIGVICGSFFSAIFATAVAFSFKIRQRNY